MPTPAGPDTTTSRGVRRSALAWNSSLTSAQFGVAADQRRLEPVDPLRAADAGQHPVGRHSRTGSALPLSACSPASANPIAAAASRCVASSTQTSPGVAADCTRAAVLTASPATMPSPTAPTVTATSPVTTPARARSPVAPTCSPELGDGRDQVQRGAHGPLGVALDRDRRAPDRHDRVADELLDHAAVAADHRAGRVEVPRQQLAHLLGIARLRQRREADQVGEQHRAHPPLGDGRIAPARHRRRAGAMLERGAALAAELLPRRVRAFRRTGSPWRAAARTHCRTCWRAHSPSAWHAAHALTLQGRGGCERRGPRRSA